MTSPGTGSGSMLRSGLWWDGSMARSHADSSWS